MKRYFKKAEVTIEYERFGKDSGRIWVWLDGRKGLLLSEGFYVLTSLQKKNLRQLFKKRLRF